MTFDSGKFNELVLYIAQESEDDPNFGKTKLNKVLFYSDFLGYGVLGHSLTGATYQRRDYGPVPMEITRARRALVDMGDADVERTWRFNYPQERLVAKRPANMSIFSAEEKRLVDNVIRALRNLSAVDASELSHREMGWQLAYDREVIPYDTVFLAGATLTATDIHSGELFWKTSDEAEVVA